MASLFIRDDETVSRVDRLSKRLGKSKTAIIRDSMRELETRLESEAKKPDFVEFLKQYRRDHPLPPPTGLKADKAFFDWLSGEEDVHDAVR